MIADGLRGLLRPFAAELDEGEHIDGDIALELRARGLECDDIGIQRMLEQVLEGYL